ncbi:MAG: hypothetical protein NVS4B2_13250 [Chloroflexota bacterium]
MSAAAETGAVVVLFNVRPATFALVVPAGVVDAPVPVGPRTTPVPDPSAPQPYPRTLTPTSGHVTAPTFVGADVVLPTEFPATCALVLVEGLVTV